jgi:isopentenyl-diphosphate delta-isomerase
MTDKVILVDESDQVLGSMDKLEAHEKGLLHRAFSVFIFNDQNELMLQQRASGKYHSGGLWTNTCCSHPAPSEKVEDACHRRLIEEMGFDTKLEFVTSFIYRAELDNDLTEHEFDHVYIGRFNGKPNPNADEVGGWKFEDMNKIKASMESNPEFYTVWFRIIFNDVHSYLLRSLEK